MKPRPKIVAAFTYADDDGWLPPAFVVGEMVVRRLAAYDQYLVGGICVDAATILPLPNPSPELIRALDAKSSEWARHDELLAERRERKDDSFREEHVDEEEEIHLVRENQSEAFAAFCEEMRAENQRLTTDRRAVVADLMRKHQRKAR
jgi:hypothetical protein